MNLSDRLEALEQRVTETVVTYRSYSMSADSLGSLVASKQKELESLGESTDLLSKSKPYLDDVIDKFSEDSIAKLESLLALGVARIFDDRKYSIQIKVCEKRNSKVAELFLVDRGNLYPLRDSSVGGGVLVVVGFLIQAFYVANLDLEKIVFLDESFSQISDAYIDNFMMFIKELASRIGLKVVLITHDKRFIEHGDQVYHVSNGVYTLEKVHG